MSDTAKAEELGVDQEGATASPSLINSKNHRPGRELDALIAERAMGWPVNRSDRHWHIVGAGNPHKCVGSKCCATRYSDGAFCPSTDIESAWKVVEKMAAGGWFVLSTIREGRTGYFANRLQPSSPVRSDIVDHVAEGESMPHAICLAALRALDARASVPAVD